MMYFLFVRSPTMVADAGHTSATMLAVGVRTLLRYTLPTFIFWFIVWGTYQYEVVKDGGQCCFTTKVCAYVTNVYLRVMYALHYEHVTRCCVVYITYPYCHIFPNLLRIVSSVRTHL